VAIELAARIAFSAKSPEIFRGRSLEFEYDPEKSDATGKSLALILKKLKPYGMTPIYWKFRPRPWTNLAFWSLA
jgi:hypothetical protein